MTTQNKCFVAMPIRKDGTPEHAHFKAIYDQVIRPVVTAAGYAVTRSDEIQRPGAITRDIILSLADADVVIADLTDLNPNVFYELGVRHALRGRGTLMIVDTSRTESIPFDLGAYRVIQFKGELTGIGRLAQELEAFLNESNTEASAQERDNPVHDWLPTLPSNAVDSAKGSVEGELRDQLKRATETVRQYERTYGKVTSQNTGDVSPLSVVMNLLDEAEEGNLPADLMKQASMSAKAFDVKSFLAAVKRIIEKKARLTDAQFRVLAGDAGQLDLPDVVAAVLDHAAQMYPLSKELRRARLALLSSSNDAGVRERTRKDLLKECGITIGDTGAVVVGEQFNNESAILVGVALDEYLRDDMNEQALAITTAMVGRLPDLTVVVRNHARSLEACGQLDESLDWYRRATWCGDATDISAVWLGNELHNRHRHIDALEAYLRACLLDPEDATNFAHVADELTYAFSDELSIRSGKENRVMPDDVTSTAIERAFIASLSCRLIGKSDMDRLASVARRAELDEVQLAGMPRVGRRERVAFAKELYARFQTSLTTPPSVAPPPPLQETAPPIRGERATPSSA
jgi:tetratricopeptide (TPR) repeat protein